jgi:hypothetical protein
MRAVLASKAGRQEHGGLNPFAQPHTAALDAAHSADVMQAIQDVLTPQH